MIRYLGCLFLFFGIFFTGFAQQKRFVFSQQKMGSPFTIIFYHHDTATAANTAEQCFQLVDSLVYIFSDYIESSELNRLCATAGSGTNGFKVSAPLLNILWLSKEAFEKSFGSFDITLGPVTRLWRKARKEKIFPTDKAVQQKLALTGFNKIQIDPTTNTVKLLQQGMQLDLGGIAQGYIAQKVIDLLTEKKILNALVDVSGDIVAIGNPPGTQGWTVGINLPESKEDLLPQTLLITNKAVTTSGDVYQFMEHNGKRYSHINNPATGYGITSQRNVTVIANDGTLADWLTKACSILPLKSAKKLATKLGAEVLIVENKRGKLRFHATGGFKHFWKPTTK